MGITVIIRSMGRPTLDRTIASVRAQDLPGVEVLIVDAKGRSLQRAAAAQAGLDEANTRWALFLDDDDELLAGHLSKLETAVQANPHAIAAYTGVEQLREGHAEVLATWNRPFEPWELLAANALPIHAVLFDRDRVRAAGVCFDASLDTFEDWDFWLQVQSVGPMVHVEGISARYWLSASGQSAAQSAHHGDHLYQAIWRKWWRLAPPEWWHQMWRAARDEPILRHRLSLAEAARRQTDAARVQAQDARVQSEEARLMAEESLEQARGIVSRQLLELQDAHALAQSRQLELDHLHGQATAMLGRLEHQQIQLRVASQQVDGLRLAEQGVRSHLHAVLRSRSWKLTAPLRWLGRQMRRVWKLRSADARRHLWWRLRHRSFPRSALLSAVMPDPYQRWLMREEAHAATQRTTAVAEINAMAGGHTGGRSGWPVISVLMPVFNPPLGFWDEAIESLRAQWYPNWELCMADDASTDPEVASRLRAWAEREPRIRWLTLPSNGHISAASNAALELAQGEWVALLDQDDLLAPEALWRVVQAVQQFPDAGLIYSDEDKVDEAGRRFGPYFKTAFDLDLLRGQNMISHLGVYRRTLLRSVGGFRVGYEGSQDHDLALRCVERLRPDQVVHIPRVLYHWRVHQASTASGQDAKPYALDAGLRAVQDHLRRCDLPGQVLPHPAIPHHVVRHARRASDSGDSSIFGLLVWGASQETAEVLGSWVALLSGRGYTVQVSASTSNWTEAVVRLKAWAASGQAGRILMIGEQIEQGALLERTTSTDGGRSGVDRLEALLAQLAEPEVGALGWAVRDNDLALHDAGWVLGNDASARPIARSTGPENHGYYGQLCLAHRVSGLNGNAVLLRLEALNMSGLGLSLSPGWRAVWTPHMEWPGKSVSSLTGHHLDATLAPLVREYSCQGQGWTDPSFSPHLCLEHADHRMSAPNEAPQIDEHELRLRARTRIPRAS